MIQTSMGTPRITVRRLGLLFFAAAAILVIAAGLIITFRTSYDRTRTSSRAAAGLMLGKEGASLDIYAPAETAASIRSAPVTGAVPAPRKIIYHATLEIKVDKGAGRAAEELARLASTLGGYVQSSTVTAAGDGKHTANLVLRVPADRLQSFLETAGKQGRIMRQELNGQDVTEEFVDLQARLRNWENQERQLNAIMARAKTVGETLAVQAELGRIRETIEQIQGKIKYYEHHAELATVSMVLYENGKPASPPWFLGELRGFGRALYDSLRVLLLTLLVLLPWSLIAWLLWRFARVFLTKPKSGT